MSDHRTIGELIRIGRVTSGELNVAVTTYLADPRPGPQYIAQDIRLDIAAAIEANGCARIFVHARGFSLEQRRSAIRTAILLARASR